jgi:hypothetical protein
LCRPRRNGRVLQRRTKAALPGDARGTVELYQEIEFFREHIVVVGKIVAEQRERFGEGATSGNYLGAPAGDEVDGGEILEYPDRIGRAQDRDRAGQANTFGHSRDRRQHHRRRRDRHIQPVMLADGENIEPRRIGKLGRRKHVCQALLGADRVAGVRIRRHLAERVKPQFERFAHRIVAPA